MMEAQGDVTSIEDYSLPCCINLISMTRMLIDIHKDYIVELLQSLAASGEIDISPAIDLTNSPQYNPSVRKKQNYIGVLADRDSAKTDMESYFDNIRDEWDDRY